MILVDVAKYFLHGFLYVAFFLIWPIGWYIAVLAFFYGTPGWVFSLAILIGLLGFSNSFIVRYLWSRVEFTFLRVVFQGIVLLALLLVMDVAVISWRVDQVVLAILGSFTIGIIGRGAAQFRIKREPVTKGQNVSNLKTGVAKKEKQ